jgi:N-acetylneuraminic acid mutarotase
MIQIVYFRKLLLVVVYVLGFLGIVASGGGGGGSDDDDDITFTAPTITDLTISPDAVYENEGGGQINILGTINFTDPDGDLSFITVTIFDSIDQEIYSETVPIIDLNLIIGLTSGVIQGEFIGNTSVVGNFRVQVYLTDANNLRSNILESNFRVSEFPWISKAAMPTKRSGFATAMLNGLIYVIGGVDLDAPVSPKPVLSTVEIYNPSADSWATGPSLLVALTNQMAATVNGKIYAIGGRGSFTTDQTDVVQEFNPDTLSWSLKTSMPDQRSKAAVATHNGIIYIAGGEAIGGSQLASLLSYDPVADFWGAGSPMSQARLSPGGAVINGEFFVYGGYNTRHIPDGGYLRSLESYDPTMDIWSAKASGEPRQDLGTAAFGDLLYAVGGSNFNGSLDLVSAYNSLTDQWVLKTPMPNSLSPVRAEVIGDKIYVFDDAITFEYTPANDIR